MWYVIVIFVIVFDIVIAAIAPSFNIIVTGSTATETTVNTTSDLIAAGSNPITFIGGITQLTIGDVVILGVVTAFLNILLVIALIRLIRGAS